MRGKVNASFERRLRRLMRWVMADPRKPEYRAARALAVPVTAAFVLVAVGAGSSDFVGWALVGCLATMVSAVVLVDTWSRNHGRPRPMCRCRREGLGLMLPKGKLRTARAVAGCVFLALAMVSVELSTAAAVLWTWFGASHLLAARTGFVGCPELGAIPSGVAGRPVSTGCGPWCWADHKLTGQARQRPV